MELLEERQDNGITVKLWWVKEGNEITVTVRDIKNGEAFALNPPSDKAHDCFLHPYTYTDYKIEVPA